MFIPFNVFQGPDISSVCMRLIEDVNKSFLIWDNSKIKKKHAIANKHVLANKV